MTDYQPIACDQHSVLELLAMHRRAVRIDFLDANYGSRVVEGSVADVSTRGGAEFLFVNAGEERVSLRLDRILAIYQGEQCVYRRQDSGNVSVST